MLVDCHSLGAKTIYENLVKSMVKLHLLSSSWTETQTDQKVFGFIEFSSEEDAKKAQEALNGTEAGGRKITVDFARPQRER